MTIFGLNDSLSLMPFGQGLAFRTDFFAFVRPGFLSVFAAFLFVTLDVAFATR